MVLVGVGVEGLEAGDDEMSDEQEDIGLSMTINDELRLCGMTGDDEDDDELTINCCFDSNLLKW